MKKLELVKGIQEWRNPKNQFYVARVHYTADPEKATEEWFKKTKKGMPKASWNKEYEIDFFALSGQRIWPEWDEKYHVVKPFDIPKEWTRIRGIDFGQYNPTCCLWGAINYDLDLYIYQEYYVGGRVTAYTHAKAIAEMSSGEEYLATYIDPSTRAKNQTKKMPEAKDDIPYSVFEIFHDCGIFCEPANNDTRAGWDRVSDYLKLMEYKQPDGTVIKKPKLYVFENCVNLRREIPRHRYAEQSVLMAQKKNPDEKQIKKEEHSCDALRYLTVSHMPAPEKEEKPLTRIQKDIQKTLGKHKDFKIEAWSQYDTT